MHRRIFYLMTRQLHSTCSAAHSGLQRLPRKLLHAAHPPPCPSLQHLLTSAPARSCFTCHAVIAPSPPSPSSHIRAPAQPLPSPIGADANAGTPHTPVSSGRVLSIGMDLPCSPTISSACGSGGSLTIGLAYRSYSSSSCDDKTTSSTRSSGSSTRLTDSANTSTGTSSSPGSPATRPSSSSDASTSISDTEWGEVEELLGRMAATKGKPNAAGGWRDAFEYLPVHLQRAGLTPERLASLNFIHVAGTKGKGSTCALLESILRRCGYRTALYTSPHLVDVRERVRLDGQMLPRAEFAASFWRVYRSLQAATQAATAATVSSGSFCPSAAAAAAPSAAKLSIPASTPGTGQGGVAVGMPSFFTFMTLVALDAFLSRPPGLRPHVVVLEVGIGGRLDATNGVTTHGSLASAAVTSLGMDHTELLGDTLPKIAREKAGIMRRGRPVLVAPQPPEAMEALQEVAARVRASMAVPPPLESYSLPSGFPSAGGGGAGAGRGLVGLGGQHMRLNASLAVALAAEWEQQYATAATAAAGASAAAAATASATAAAVDVGASGAASPADAIAFAAVSSDIAAAAVAEAVAAAVGRPMALAPGGPLAAEAACRAEAVARRVALPGPYVEGLRAVQWPGRSQVIADEMVAARGGQLTWYLDGAHTPESLAACAAWLRGELQAAAAGTGGAAASSCRPHGPPRRHALALLFNCMRDRDPAVLLPPLAEVLTADAAEAGWTTPGPGAAAVGLQAVIFTPMLSGGGVLLAAGTSAQQTLQTQQTQAPLLLQQQAQQQDQRPNVDLSWQVRMRDVWSAGALHARSLIRRDAKPVSTNKNAAAATHGSAAEAVGAASAVGPSAAAAAIAREWEEDPVRLLHGQPSISVAPSLPNALAAIRAAALNDPMVHVHVLVTGSLYLVGDVLRLLGKPPA